ncbi:MAG: sulfotransferase family 2 domain-containing protein [Sphingomonadales bacterium]|nr:sulfotransferase family 2 domain-containing protein [Sphingomonadales bacterium]MDE2567475.1 sulfotransferase family 2 domain-containing protein [Sphingomonadales bacterium]
MLEQLVPALETLRDCRLRETCRQFGRHFLLDQIVPKRASARRSDYALSAMLATGSTFVHVPKTAGVSVLRALYGNIGMGHMSIREYQRILGPSFLNRAFVFTVVRNPWDRLFSAYSFLRAGGWPGSRDILYYEKIKDCASFEHFVLDYLGREDIREFDHFRPSLEYLVDDTGEVFPFDFIGRYARLDEDFGHLADLFGVDPALPRLNTGKNSGERKYLKAYTPRMIDTVAEYYGETIEALGYWFDGYADTVPALDRSRATHPHKRRATPSARLQNAAADVIAAP